MSLFQEATQRLDGREADLFFSTLGFRSGGREGRGLQSSFAMPVLGMLK